MSKFPGGIFSKSSGKVSGLVFSQARTRTGKVMTARELVIPSNPQTPLQTQNRVAMHFCTKVVQGLGTSIYRVDWDNAVGMNAGYQSLLSLIKSSYRPRASAGPNHVSLLESSPADTDLGDLHAPDSVTLSRQDVGDYRVTWSTENGDNGSASDQAIVFGVTGKIFGNTLDLTLFSIDTSKIRSDGLVDLPEMLEITDAAPLCLSCIYFRSGLAEPNHLSAAKWRNI